MVSSDFFLLWPAWLMIDGDAAVAKELAIAKGKQKRLKKVLIENNCK